MEKTKVKERKTYIDILNILAILAVVFMHHNNIVHSWHGQRLLATSLIVQVLCYFAVPVFVMNTGATLMRYREKYDTKTFFLKRFLKVLIPAIFWIIAMFVYRVFIVKNMTVTDWSPLNLLNLVLNNKIETIYYFIFVILGVYLTLPVLSHLAKPRYHKTLWYAVGAFFIFNALLPNLLLLIGVEANSSLALLIGNYMFYAILGYLLSVTKLSKKQRIALYVAGALSVVYHYLTRYLLSANAGNIVTITSGYFQFHTIIFSAAVFVLVKQLASKINFSERVKKTLQILAGCSFGIYLVHRFIIIATYQAPKLGLEKIDIESISWRLLWPFITYFISLAIVLIMKKLPVLRKFVP